MYDYNLYLNIAFGLFLLATIMFITSFILNKNVLRLPALVSFITGSISITLSLAARWFYTGHIPLSNTYETVVLLSWLVTLFYFYFLKNDRERILATGCSVLILILLGLTSFITDSPRPLVPALRSNWLTIHVLFCFISYAAFTISFISGVLYFIFSRKGSSLRFETVTINTVLFGYAFLILGITSGSIWGDQVWGSYWSWDPKETWSLITLLVYTIYLHINIAGYLSQFKRILLANFCFLFVLFTYFGVNYLLSGLHSYA